jgi:hypothetical protein
MRRIAAVAALALVATVATGIERPAIAGGSPPVAGGSPPVAGGYPAVVDGTAPALHPEGVAWDPGRRAFLVGSVRHGTISVVGPGGRVTTLVGPDGRCTSSTWPSDPVRTSRTTSRSIPPATPT